MIHEHLWRKKCRYLISHNEFLAMGKVEKIIFLQALRTGGAQISCPMIKTNKRKHEKGNE